MQLTSPWGFQRYVTKALLGGDRGCGHSPAKTGDVTTVVYGTVVTTVTGDCAPS